jgi:hypothetical protein
MADDDTIMNRLVLNDEATFHLADLTLMDFFLCSFVKGNVYIPAADNTTRAQDMDQRSLCETLIRNSPEHVSGR